MSAGFRGVRIEPAYLPLQSRRRGETTLRGQGRLTDDNGVAFKWKDHRIDAPQRFMVMTLDTREFIHRFLTHVLPQGF